MSLGEWITIDEQARIFSLEYSFGPGLATACVFGLGPRELGILSPPCGFEPSVFDALGSYGKIVAIIPPSRAHHLGIPVCQERYPAAKIYADKKEASSIKKKNKYLRDASFESLDDLQDRLPDAVEILVPPHMRITDLVGRFKTDKGYVWYFNDIVTNQQELPKNPVLHFLLKVTRSGPGFSINRFFCKVAVSKKRPFRDWVLEELSTSPPAAIVLGHGPHVREDALAPRISSMFQQAL